MPHSYQRFEDTPLWRTVQAAIEELVTARDIQVATAPDYVIGYLCQQLSVRGLLNDNALSYDP